MKQEYITLVHDLIVNMSGTFAFCVFGFFSIFVTKIIADSLTKNSSAVDAYNAQKLHLDHEIKKMEEQRKLIEQQVSNKVHNVRRLGEDRNDA